MVGTIRITRHEYSVITTISNARNASNRYIAIYTVNGGFIDKYTVRVISISLRKTFTTQVNRAAVGIYGCLGHRDTFKLIGINAIAFSAC